MTTPTPTKIFISSNENPTYIQFWPLTAAAWRHLGFEPVLALVTNRPEAQWAWMKEYGEVVRFYENSEIPSGNWAKMVRWWLYFKYEDEIGIVSDMDMLPLQRDYFVELPEEYDPDHHLLLKGTYDTSKAGKFPGCYMTAKGKIWKEILQPEKFDGPHEFVRQFFDSQLYDHKEATNAPYNIFSEESLMRAVVLTWDPEGERTIRLSRPGGWMHGVKSTSLRVDRSQWPNTQGLPVMGFTPDKSYPNALARPNHPPPHETYYIDSHLLRPLERYKEHIYFLLDYLGLDHSLIETGINLSKEMSEA